ncbi:hypothetical protein LHW04_08580 [Bacillus tropicus]|nr:hypothetical protein [Bacillus tropicus]MCC1488820.1 hypothetical protein [Bacillus tropicus]MCC2336770.1 hypothetical protein [Bacillus tropicus]UBM53180.1 hypothetical protein K8M08_24970 [Bacillus sp. CRB-7]
MCGVYRFFPRICIPTCREDAISI